MYALVSQLRSGSVAVTEAVCFTASLLVAEFFFRFHSFTLECAAFLALWFCLSWLASLAVRRREGGPPAV